MKKDTAIPSRRISGRTVAIIMVLSLVLGVILVFASVYINGSPTKTASMTGLLEVYTGGEYTGPNASAASYNVTLVAKAGTGTLSLTKVGGSSDPVTLNNYSISGFILSPYALNMTLSGSSMSLGWVNNSTVWTDVNASYVAAVGPHAPASQLAGVTNQSAFQGLSSQDYILLTITITSQPQNTIPFVLSPVLEESR